MSLIRKGNFSLARYAKALSFFICCFAVVTHQVVAAGLTLQKIGVSEVGGRRISSWTYQGYNPVFTGTAGPGATVTITIDSTPATTTADSSGKWTWTPTTLTSEATHQVAIASGDQSISFTLGVSAYTGSGAVTATDSGTTSKGGVTELPVAGGLEETVQFVIWGLTLITFGLVSRWVYREWATEARRS